MSWYRIVGVRHARNKKGEPTGRITHVLCEDPRGAYLGLWTIAKVRKHMEKGEEFFVTRTSWSRVHAHGGHIQVNPDRCGHNNLDDLVEV